VPILFDCGATCCTLERRQERHRHPLQRLDNVAAQSQEESMTATARVAGLAAQFTAGNDMAIAAIAGCTAEQWQ